MENELSISTVNEKSEEIQTKLDFKVTVFSNFILLAVIYYGLIFFFIINKPHHIKSLKYYRSFIHSKFLP